MSHHSPTDTPTIGQRIITFNKGLQYTGKLPEGFAVLNPYLDNPETLQVMTSFYDKYYNDQAPRKFIIGINPSRHGAGGYRGAFYRYQALGKRLWYPHAFGSYP